LSYVLSKLSKLLAPFAPFLSESIYKDLEEKEESVHLEDYPLPQKSLIDERLEKDMAAVRELVNLGLKERAKAGLKVRQPLAQLQIPKAKDKLPAELLDLLKEELNVKTVSVGKELKLDVKVTENLREEGVVREIIHNIQTMRKKAGLKPSDRVEVRYSGSPELNKIIAENKKHLLLEAKIKDLLAGDRPKQVFGIEREIEIDRQKLWLGLKKI